MESQLFTPLLNGYHRCLSDIKLIEVDALGIECKKTEMSRKEEREQAALDRTTFWKDGCITVQMLWKGEFSASYSWINPCLTAGKQTEVWYCHATCGHRETFGKTAIFTSIVYGYRGFPQILLTWWPIVNSLALWSWTKWWSNFKLVRSRTCCQLIDSELPLLEDSGVCLLPKTTCWSRRSLWSNSSSACCNFKEKSNWL